MDNVFDIQICERCRSGWLQSCFQGQDNVFTQHFFSWDLTLHLKLWDFHKLRIQDADLTYQLLKYQNAKVTKILWSCPSIIWQLHLIRKVTYWNYTTFSFTWLKLLWLEIRSTSPKLVPADSTEVFIMQITERAQWNCLLRKSLHSFSAYLNFSLQTAGQTLIITWIHRQVENKLGHTSWAKNTSCPPHCLLPIPNSSTDIFALDTKKYCKKTSWENRGGQNVDLVHIICSSVCSTQSTASTWKQSRTHLNCTPLRTDMEVAIMT